MQGLFLALSSVKKQLKKVSNPAPECEELEAKCHPSFDPLGGSNAAICLEALICIFMSPNLLFGSWSLTANEESLPVHAEETWSL